MLIPSLPDPLTPAENAVREQFAGRPTLESVTRQLLTAVINEKYPALNIDLAHARLAMPRPDTGWMLSRLMTRVMDYLASGADLDLGPLDSRACYLSDWEGTPLSVTAGSPDMKIIEALIKELRWTVPMGLQSALRDYWAGDSEVGVSRWRWFSDVLNDTLSISAVMQESLSDRAREMIEQVIQCPEGEERVRHYGKDATHAYCLETTLTSSTRLSSEILLVRADLLLLCKPDGHVRPFPAWDAVIEYEGQRLGEMYAVDKVRIQRYELDGNIFDIQAEIIINQQLESLGALQLPTTVGLEALQAVYLELSDPAQYLLDAPPANQQLLGVLKTRLPDWLQQASSASQALYRRYSLALARAKKNSQGRTFLSGLLDIHTFATVALGQQMAFDQGRFEQKVPGKKAVAVHSSNDIELTFLKAAGYPGTVGIVEPVTMSLTDLALKNLIGRPQGQLLLRHRLGLALPAWLTPDYITRRGGLIEQVNIGGVYPQRLKNVLLSETPDAHERERLFADQLRVQLPLQALELSLKQKNGVTARGARYIAQLMQGMAAERQVDEPPPIAIRHLALVRKPGARPDVVSSMYIIEPADMAVGPHLLYRPFYAPSLHEFSTRDALLSAIATPGALQDSVLTWLTDSARPIYANGGFQEPHYVRYGQGSEFAPIEAPLPAALSSDDTGDELQQYLHSGKLLQYLYGITVRALVDQAQREAVSNSQSRWSALLEGGGLLFNSVLLPVLRGPAMMTGWLFSLMLSASQDIPALNSEDPITRELATVDVLLNLAMLLFQVAPSTLSVRPKRVQVAWEQVVRARAPLRLAEQWPTPVAPKILDGTVALAGELFKLNSTALDFSFASARNRLAPSQRLQLARLQVTPRAPLPEPIGKGLYVINGKWHAKVEGSLYRIEEQAGGDFVIVDPLGINRLGPCLRWSDGQWTFDLRLRLRGGMPPKRIANQREKNAQRRAQLKDEMTRFMAQQEARINEGRIAKSVMERAQQDDRFTAEQRASYRQRYRNTLQTQMASYQHLLESNKECTELQIPLPQEMLAIQMENVIMVARESVWVTELDRTALLEKWTRFAVYGRELERAVAADRVGFTAFVKEMLEINERALRLLELKDHYLDELFNLSQLGAERYKSLTGDLLAEKQCALCLKAMQFQVLGLSSIKVWRRTLLDSLRSVFNLLQEQIGTQLDLSGHDFSPSEHLQVLDSLVKRYGQALDALQGISIVNADELDHVYFAKLLKVVEDLYQGAAHALAGEIKPPVKPRKQVPGRPPAQSERSQKRVIKTRNRGTLIGELKPAMREGQDDVIEVRSKGNNELLATYSQRGDEWDVVEVKIAKPVVPTRPLSLIKGEARKLFHQLEEHLKRAESYKKISRYPQELEELLKREADRFDYMAAELEQAILALPATSRLEVDQVLVNNLHRGGVRLTYKARELRVQLSFELPPTHGNLQYLLDQGLVQISRLGERVSLRSGFMQEYSISKRAGPPLWYAHFHYAAPDTPKRNYDVAHLKTREQRKQSYYSLLAETQNPQATINVHHGLIGKDLAERWFLPLAP